MIPFWNFKVNGSTVGKVRVYTVIPVYTLKSKFWRFRHILLIQSILLWAFPKISTLYWYSTLYGYSRYESTWFCYQLIAKPGNKTVAVSWPDPYAHGLCFLMFRWHLKIINPFAFQQISLAQEQLGGKREGGVLGCWIGMLSTICWLETL